MPPKLTPLQKLEGRRERLQTLIAAETARENANVNGLGFGCAMRGYHRLKNLSFKKGDELRERLEKVEAELVKLGWVDPTKPVQPERSPEEQWRDYCEIMGLDYEEQKKLRESLQIA